MFPLSCCRGGRKASCITEEPSALVCITWIWHREVLCEAVQGEMDIKAQGPCPNAKRLTPAMGLARRNWRTQMSCEAAAGEVRKCFYSVSLDWVRLGALGCCFSLLMHMLQPLALHCLFRSVLRIF